MRITVKAKLATALGALILVTGLTGATATLKLSQLPTRAADIARAGQMQRSLPAQTGAAKDVVIASGDAEIARFSEELKAQRRQAADSLRTIAAHVEESERKRVEAIADGAPLGLGLMTDRVFAVSDLDGGALEPAPSIGQGWRADGVIGVGREGGRFVVALDLDRLVASDGLPFPNRAA